MAVRLQGATRGIQAYRVRPQPMFVENQITQEEHTMTSETSPWQTGPRPSICVTLLLATLAVERTFPAAGAVTPTAEPLTQAVAPDAPEDRPLPRSGCADCHAGIEWIRDPASVMMQQIVSQGKRFDDPVGCVVCHGGDPLATTAEEAHAGRSFYPSPSSPWINELTCGPCHPRHTGAQWTSLMMTESGKIQGTSWSFGGLEGYEHRWGNYEVKNPADPAKRVGTPAYRSYMEALGRLEPNVFPDGQTTVPAAVTDLTTLKDQPEQAAFTYIRSECQRCHLAVRGRQKRGDYRGMGCAACHIPYSDNGLYEGDDPTTPKDEPGHLLVHSIQSTREATVTVGDLTYSGIPLKTCETCHNRGKRIGVSFQGLMESAFESPFTEGGGGQKQDE